MNKHTKITFFSVLLILGGATLLDMTSLEMLGRCSIASGMIILIFGNIVATAS